ncbi:glycosyltransferase family 2 protein [Mucilaginibacter sp. UR6-11]|uniref:glycosyltransferase family 2 protein n=1 Tax=Mucilaginibacter sp. UR6-11 TaxID=1435644 RepID=UPI001E4F6BCE|nr:glycosyltransferase family 2 protein [Mucilaginibacter sp. UR6-11]MCC8424694.1 glycosyltransferase family 2 protein [Mucilaginibacter sp. UR6-11]
MTVKLLIIVPCYNEQAALPDLLTELDKLSIPGYEITTLVVNDCSTDDTYAVAIRHNVKVLNLPINLGIGGAVQSGLIYAFNHQFDLAVQLDGDGQHPPKELTKLLTCHRATGANLVIGSRFIKKEGFQSSFTRRLGIGYFHRLNRFFTGMYIFDSTSGFRLFDKKAIELASVYYPDDYPEPESLVYFAKAGFSIEETPVIMAGRVSGQSSIRNFASLYYCIKVTIAMFFSAIRKTQ